VEKLSDYIAMTLNISFQISGQVGLSQTVEVNSGASLYFIFYSKTTSADDYFSQKHK